MCDGEKVRHAWIYGGMCEIRPPVYKYIGILAEIPRCMQGLIQSFLADILGRMQVLIHRNIVRYSWPDIKNLMHRNIGRNS